jgi:hypothetical protein
MRTHPSSAAAAASNQQVGLAEVAGLEQQRDFIVAVDGGAPGHPGVHFRIDDDGGNVQGVDDRTRGFPAGDHDAARPGRHRGRR